MGTRRLSIPRLLWPDRNLMAVAFAAMLVQGLADVLEPWPLKIIFDSVLGSKPAPAWLAGWLADGDRLAVLNAPHWR